MGAKKLYPTPCGYTEKRPDVVMPPVDRGLISADIARLAKAIRHRFDTEREARAYAFAAVWKQVRAARSILMLTLQVRQQTPVDRAAIDKSRAATRRSGSSLWGH